MSFANLKINRVIFHELFTKEIDNPVPPMLNDAIEVLSEETKNELKARVVNSLSNSSHCMKMEISQTYTGSFFNLVSHLLSNANINDSEFINASKDLTLKLASTQTTRNIPGGVVVVFDGTLGYNDDKFVCIIKAEKHSGFRKEYNSVQFITDLFLTPQQRLHKIAFISCNVDSQAINPEDVNAWVFDSSISKTRSNEIANYFYDSFMGCVFPGTSDVLTKNFFIHTKEFISDCTDLTSEEKLDKITALHTYLKVDNVETISTNDFSERYLNSPEMMDDYISYMDEKKMPEGGIFKDLSMMPPIVFKRKINFTNKVQLILPSEGNIDSIKILEASDEFTDIRIKGKINSET